MDIPFRKEIVDGILADIHIARISDATIRQTVTVSQRLEQQTGQKFIHFEIGSPGIPAESIGIQAQKKALDSGIASVYPNINGIPELKNAASRFIKAFLDIDIRPEGCVPTVGSMMGSFASFILCRHLREERDTILYINPGFPVQPLQSKILGYNRIDFDIYEFRGEKLYEKLDSLLSQGRIAAIIYSNPNNPSWVCLTEKELEYIGMLATRYDAVVIEDLAYLGMDFRRDLGKPFQPPYQPTVARYTDNYILMLSASKIFSYAGERIAIVAISDVLYHRSYPYLLQTLGMETVGSAFVYTILYALSSGVTHSAQFALAAMYDAACRGDLDFVAHTHLYADRAARLKEIFLRHGFHIVYDKDMDKDISDGFFFTIGRKGFTGDDLLSQLLYYGVSAISLSSTGSRQEGIRICTSTVADDDYGLLDERLRIFNKDFPVSEL